ncbi:ABC transporter permease [Natronolimnohabitans innermongolicus]|uniref:Oligopeptide transport system permease OppC n=1 Tax=Natronolimnohabitans innermongolicus JCM 12255 TaxID=1227499 RepID=L9XDX1_9EURY|nr:ABC transporter permease [Natronolimnohabitans innermongolicus]ELY59636.1 oligopeptide transport system permease OppC [Natronolimnohabitans innermongolicus JCM 12255]
MTKTTDGRGRIQITGFDADEVKEREPLSDWQETSGGEAVGRWTRVWERFKRNRTALIGLTIVAVMSLLAIFARPVEVMGLTVQPISLAPYPPEEILWIRHDVSQNTPPSWSHPMGIDGEARDVFSRVLAGGRYSISIGFVVVAITGTIGLVYGSISGYFGGWIDEVMMRIVDMILAFPALILAMIIVSMFGGGYWQLVAAFTIFGWATYARLMRGEVLKIKENEYVMAAKALGARDRLVIFRHIVPNAVPPLIVYATLQIGTVVIGVAALGFLGLGMDPGTAEWGTMLENGRNAIIPGPGGDIRWWITVFPGAAIFLFVMSMNMIGDGVNDALDAQETGVAGGGDK